MEHTNLAKKTKKVVSDQTTFLVGDKQLFSCARRVSCCSLWITERSRLSYFSSKNGTQMKLVPKVSGLHSDVSDYWNLDHGLDHERIVFS